MIETCLGPARVAWTDRHGGVSGGDYATLNLGGRVGDDPTRVRENRDRVARQLGLVPPSRWQWLRQVHGAHVITTRTAPGAAAPEADAAVTRVPDLPLVVLTADCAPLALATDDAVAVVHAGHPGLLAGVVEAAVAALEDVGTGSVRAALGPCIHPARYEFGAADLAPLVDRLGKEVVGRTPDGSPALDVPAAVRAALAHAGVSDLADVDVCTSGSPDHFSQRRDGRTGRQALIAWLPT